MDDMSTLDSILESATPEALATVEPAQTQEQDVAEATPAKEPEQQEQQEQEVKTPEEIFGGKKSANETFAKMRTENAKFQRTITQLGTILGIANPNDPDALVNGLQQKILEFQSQQQKIPVEILERLEKAEDNSFKYERDRIEQQAKLSFQNVKDTYKLSDAQLQAFAQKLMDAGKNPFVTPINLMDEYKMLYFDELIAKNTRDTEKEVLARQQKVAAHSTAPSKITGGVSTPSSTKGDMTALNSMLREFPS